MKREQEKKKRTNFTVDLKRCKKKETENRKQKIGKKKQWKEKNRKNVKETMNGIVSVCWSIRKSLKDDDKLTDDKR